jgi:hypothetical protein
VTSTLGRSQPRSVNPLPPTPQTIPEAIGKNTAIARARTRSLIMAVVKADGYGHGAPAMDGWTCCASMNSATCNSTAAARICCSKVLTEREEKASVAIASHESFGGWTKTFTDPRLCAAIVERLTFGGTIIETGTDSYRLAQSKQLRG